MGFSPWNFTNAFIVINTFVLQDPVYSVRAAASRNLASLACTLGVEWAQEHVVQQVGSCVSACDGFIRRMMN